MALETASGTFRLGAQLLPVPANVRSLHATKSLLGLSGVLKRPSATASSRAVGCRSLTGRFPVCYADSSPRPVQAAIIERQQVFVREDILKPYLKLQNGSDIRGVAVEGVAGEPVTLTPTIALFLGYAFADWLADKTGIPHSSLRVSVGRDPRISGSALSGAFCTGLACRGVQVTRFGLATTPAMFMSCVMPGHNYDGGVMLTASHLPFNRNGFKFCTADGGLEKPDISDILQRAAAWAQREDVLPGQDWKGMSYLLTMAMSVDPALVQYMDFIPVYAQYMRTLVKQGINHPTHFDTPLEGFKIVVNPGNGGGGFIAKQVLGPLGADVTASFNLEPDGTFPNHIPNPEDPTAVQSTIAQVLISGADLGIILDPDVDRSGVVDASGKVINANRYIALNAAITLRSYPGTTIVTDSVTSNGLTTFIQQLGGKHMRFKRGYRNVIGKGIELNKQGVDTQLVMETSGHGAMKENFFLDDGAYSAIKIVIELARRRLEGKGGLMDLLADLPEPLEAQEARLRVLASDFKTESAKILKDFHEWVVSGAGGNNSWKLEDVNHEGWRVNVDEGDGKRGWILMRASLHDPLIVVNAESDVVGGVRAILDHLVTGFFESHPTYCVDITKLGGRAPPPSCEI